MADFAEDLEMQTRVDLDDELTEHRAAYNFGRSVQRVQDRSNHLLGFMFCAFSGFLVGLLAAAVMHAIWGS
jgi:hypothetical protein